MPIKTLSARRVLSLTAALVFAVTSLDPHAAYAAAPPALSVSTPAPAPLASVAERSKQLSALFATMWEENLKENPEFASTLGDKRYDDKLTDYSVEAIN